MEGNTQQGNHCDFNGAINLFRVERGVRFKKIGIVALLKEDSTADDANAAAEDN